MRTPEDALIQLRNIRKVYRAGKIETTALDDVTLSIHEGEFAGIMGPSGCGKSTLLNIVAMLNSPSAGLYLLGGIDVGQTRAAAA